MGTLQVILGDIFLYELDSVSVDVLGMRLCKCVHNKLSCTRLQSWRYNLQAATAIASYDVVVSLTENQVRIISVLLLSHSVNVW